MAFGSKTQWVVGAAVALAAIGCVVAGEITSTGEKPPMGYTGSVIVVDSADKHMAAEKSPTGITPPTFIAWDSTAAAVPLGAPSFNQMPPTSDARTARAQKFQAEGEHLDALKKIVDDQESALNTFRQSHGISASGIQQNVEVETMSRINEKLLDAQMKLVVDQTRLETMRKRAADDKTLADFQETVDEDTAVVQLLQKNRDAQYRKLQDLDYFLVQYERIAANVKAYEAALTQMTVQMTLEMIQEQ